MLKKNSQNFLRDLSRLKLADTKVQKQSKIFSFHKKTGPDWNRTSVICRLKHGYYHCAKHRIY